MEDLVTENVNNEYYELTKKILNNEDFKKLHYIKHHKGSRLEHSLLVSKKAYIIAKKFNWDYKSVAKAGLLHDFFIIDYKKNNIHTLKNNIRLIFKHGELAAKNSECFNLNEKEKNIIESHMFPLSSKIPRSKEAFTVSLIDKISALYELCYNIKYSYATTILSIVIITKNLF